MSVVGSTAIIVDRIDGGSMAGKKAVKFTKFEIEIMDVLWELKRASVREIQEQLPESKSPAYTTVQTIVYRLEEKGAVRRVKKIGNAYLFEPVITRKSVHRGLIDELLDMLGNSTRPLMAHLIESGRLTLDNLRELENTLAELEDDEPGDKKLEDKKPEDKKSGGEKRS
jgi:BlaI family transcriptional regulator, penicillinase repressor